MTKIVKIGHRQEVEIPTSWEEGEEMVTEVLRAGYHKRGKNLARQSVAARVAFGMFGKGFMAPDPTEALLFLIQRICQRKGAGLD